jgi:hypothetical protein
MVAIALVGTLACAVLVACVDGGSTPAVSGSAPGPQAAVLPSSAGANWLESELAAQDGLLWVYRDNSDGLNNFTQKAFMGDNYRTIPEMDEGAEAHSGTSGIMAELDTTKHIWGGYMFLNGTLEAGSNSPRANDGRLDAGIDLTGAETLTFYAKGESGEEHVDFFAGGFGWEEGRRNADNPDSTQQISLGTVDLTEDWRKYQFSLANADLSSIACGFGWVVSSAGNVGLTTVRFYMDDIRYEFAEDTPRPLFLQSYASAKPGTDEAIINNFAYLYDNAVAALALSYAGKVERSLQIADAIVYAYRHDRYYSDGRMRNAYSSGKPASFPGWTSGKGEEFARIPGFYDATAKEWYEDFYAVSTSPGNLAWAVLALCQASKDAPGADEYLSAAKGMGDFILTLRSETGGFTGGYEGWEPSPTKVTYKSTEHNIDLITVFAKLADLTGDSRYADGSAHAKAFVLSMYDPKENLFYTGTGEDGVTPSKEVLPLDSNTWALLALGDDFKDGAKVMDSVERTMGVDGGYDFNSDKDGVWFEGTAQAALAYKLLGNEDKYHKILDLLNARAEPDGSITAADRDGVSTGFMVSGTDIPWNYGKRVHVGATAWLAFAQLGVNPLA